jgi:hypothetical protein
MDESAVLHRANVTIHARRRSLLVGILYEWQIGNSQPAGVLIADVETRGLG